VKKGETKLLEKLNEWISTNVKNGRLNGYFKKFHSIDIPDEFLQ
jgi:polar amino acid transport system substrate-binding protein